MAVPAVMKRTRSGALVSGGTRAPPVKPVRNWVDHGDIQTVIKRYYTRFCVHDIVSTHYFFYYIRVLYAELY